MNPQKLHLLRFNISGRHFQIQRTTAAKYPGSVFGLLASGSREGREHVLRSKSIFSLTSSSNNDQDNEEEVDDGEEDEEEFFVERSIPAFELIIDYMCTGRLHCPTSVCKEVLRNELAFWRLFDVPLADCCWDDEDEDTEIQKQLIEKAERERKRRKRLALRGSDDREENDEDAAATTVQNKFGKYAKKIRVILKQVVGKPTSSNAATIFSSLSVFFITLAVTNLIVSTLPSLQNCVDPKTHAEMIANASDNSTGPMPPRPLRRKFLGLKYRENCDGSIIFEIVEAICVGWFTFEWALRFICATRKCGFLKSPMNIIDLLAIIPFYVDVIVFYIDEDTSRRHKGIQSLLSVLRVFRAFRLFNVVRLARYSESLKLMGSSLWMSRNELGILVVFIGFTITIFSSIVYYCEKDLENTAFTSIPATLYWGIVTVTTVGYGDMAPTSVPGKLFASVCCVSGIIIMAFPVSILVEHFHRLYRRRARQSPAPHRLAILIGTNEIGVVQSHCMPPRRDSVQEMTSSKL